MATVGSNVSEISIPRRCKRTAPTIPSSVAPYPALPKFPIVHTAGHSPATLSNPGKLTFASTYPPVKQNLFQLVTIPP